MIFHYITCHDIYCSCSNFGTEGKTMSKVQRELLDAQLRGTGVGSEQSVGEIRENFAKLMNALPVPEGIHVHETSLGGRPALRVSPDAGAGSGILLYLHGGSHVVGSPRTALGLAAGLVARTGIPGISLDYRLAPEHPFPADVQDVVAAYRELLEQGHAPKSIAFAGDSAGGGLTITGALAARDAGLPMPAAIVTFSPGVDATRTGESMVTKAEQDPLLDRASLDRMSSLYVVDQDRRNPAAQPRGDCRPNRPAARAGPGRHERDAPRRRTPARSARVRRRG
jgi:monoterpene epsilon-lactone hydrolase